MGAESSGGTTFDINRLPAVVRPPALLVRAAWRVILRLWGRRGEVLMRPASRAWLRENQTEERLWTFPLDAQSIVLDVGGYHGAWAARIVDRYGCRVHVFEPVPAFAAAIADRFADDSRVVSHDYGLGGRDERARIALVDNRSSTVVERDRPGVEIDLRDIDAVLAELGIGRVALIKINIEGGEYDLLDRLIATGAIKRVDRLLVQFHDFAPRARERYTTIATALTATHRITFRYPFVWESWAQPE